MTQETAQERCLLPRLKKLCINLRAHVVGEKMVPKFLTPNVYHHKSQTSTTWYSGLQSNDVLGSGWSCSPPTNLTAHSLIIYFTASFGSYFKSDPTWFLPYLLFCYIVYKPVGHIKIYTSSLNLFLIIELRLNYLSSLQEISSKSHSATTYSSK